MSSYLKVIEKSKPQKKAEEARIPSPAPSKKPATTKTTNTTKASEARPAKNTNFTPLTVSEALVEINRRGSGANKNTELYRRGGLSEEMAVEYVTCAILHRRGESFEVWRHHALAVRKALNLCIHELPPDECKICNGYVKKLIKEGG